MPIDIRARIPSHAASAEGTAFDHYLGFYRPRTAGAFAPSVIVAAAQEQERLGFDSSLFPQRATGPAVWPVTGWALSATQRLRIVSAHRVGIEQPTVAARTVATLDRLSNGRLAVHVLQGREDADMQRDGVFLDKLARYALAHEYLEVFFNTLQGGGPFDYQGQYYQIQGAQADVQPISQPRPVISIPGTSDAGVDLAAQFADIYSVPIATLETARKAIARIRQRAQALGRTRPLGYWGDCNIILGEDDDQAWDIAHRVADQLERDQRVSESPGYDHGNAQAALQQFGTPTEHSGPWYPRLNALSGHGYTLVGSVTTLAAHLLRFYAAGVTTLTLGGIANRFSANGQSLSDPVQLRLLSSLIDTLRDGAHALDKAAAPLPLPEALPHRT
ncbi:LLM class flavin-dependent oxidoreductase [Pseudomonas sp. S31]|uniref:LLM class flavin-dependent oxidoreductase n=1 Tax=Pseudomonas sp. S31 TaxID=1564473 RepID=UPI001913A3D8|nr:LLM class flavin-dependent oxidoreductase [Pseudomonas sp. S31]MBK4999742.1 LLM class flavin-dependent oxidoreductase [Pseudomonas sp. S31]